MHNFTVIQEDINRIFFHLSSYLRLELKKQNTFSILRKCEISSILRKFHEISFSPKSSKHLHFCIFCKQFSRIYKKLFSRKFSRKCRQCLMPIFHFWWPARRDIDQFHEGIWRWVSLKFQLLEHQNYCKPKSELTVSSTGRRSPSKASSVTTTVPGGRPIPPHVPILHKKRTFLFFIVKFLSHSTANQW